MSIFVTHYRHKQQSHRGNSVASRRAVRRQTTSSQFDKQGSELPLHVPATKVSETSVRSFSRLSLFLSEFNVEKALTSFGLLGAVLSVLFAIADLCFGWPMMAASPIGDMLLCVAGILLCAASLNVFLEQTRHVRRFRKKES